MRYMSTYYWQRQKFLDRGSRDKEMQGQDTWDRKPGCEEESAENTTSLVLAQYRYREVPLCFACVCSLEGSDGKAEAYLSGRLISWQQGLPWEKIAANPEQWLEKLEKKLACQVEHIDRELADSGLVSQKERAGMAGILCAGGYGLVFSRGEQEVYLLNTGFGRGYIEKINGKDTMPYGQAGAHSGQEAITPSGEENGEELRVQQGILEQGAGFLVATKSFGRVVAQKDAGACLYVQEVRTAKQAGRHLEELGTCGEALGETDMGAVLVYIGKEEQEVSPRPENKREGMRPGSEKSHPETERKSSCKAWRQGETGGEREKSSARGGRSRRNEGLKESPGGRPSEELPGEKPSEGLSRERPPEELPGEKLSEGLSGRRQSGERPPEESARARERAEDRAFLERRGYRVQRFLGQGAFSRVYLAARTDDEYVACKVSFRTELAEGEARLLRRVEHPLFVAYREYWQEGDRSCLVMEYVPGSSLEALLRRRGRLAARRAAQVALELAEGLRYLHNMKDEILFRDLKPANIMIRQDGRVKLLDLGCACPLEAADASRAGTPGFGAPEQFETTKKAGPVSDVYGVGQVLWAMLGTPCGAQEDFQVSRRWKNRGRLRKKDRYIALSRRTGFGRKGLGRGAVQLRERRYRHRLQNVAAICIRQDSEGRFPDMQSLVNALSSYLAGGAWSRCRGGSGDLHRSILSGRNLACEKNIWKSACKNY